jgi:hypothetical protein
LFFLEYSAPLSPSDSDEDEDSEATKAADPCPKSAMEEDETEVLKKDEVENDLASSSSDVNEKAEDVRTETVRLTFKQSF